MMPQYGAYAFHAGLARLHARTHAHTNEYVVFIATVVKRTRLSITLYVNFLSCYHHLLVAIVCTFLLQRGKENHPKCFSSCAACSRIIPRL